MNELLYVKEVPWKGLGTQYDTQPENMLDLVNKAKLNWECSYLPMSTERDAKVFNYNAIYREDTQDILGVVNKPHPLIVQNAEMFNAFDYLLGTAVDVDTASSFDGGQNVFGSFKIHQQYKIFDDNIDHYFVVVNDHLKVDGKVSVLNTPVRVICQNTLELAMHRNFYHLRVPMGADESINRSVSSSIINSVSDAIFSIQDRAEKMYKQKLEPQHVDKIIDELFPFPDVDENDTVLHTKTIENIEIMRDTFKSQCLDVDNLDNYRGTAWQIYNAFADWDQHFYKKADNAYDLGYRMKRLSGVGTPTEPPKTIKLLKVLDKIAA